MLSFKPLQPILGGALILGSASLSFAQDPWDSSVSWDISGETIFTTGKHFEIRKKPTHDDGSANNPSPTTADMNTALGYLETAWVKYHDEMGLLATAIATGNLWSTSKTITVADLQ